ncbi:P-loop containing nucleoside triphosphate hydrolase protein [Trichophaea hybrida]|nr:P-loop containing nucleoside triphosphate hydrolase protein [Trichophaea hybrida]
MQMASAHARKCTCCHTPPEDPSEATSTDLCSPTLCPTFPTDQPLAQTVTTEHVQQFLDILKSLNTKQGPSPKSPDLPETAPASRLEFKTVNEVWDEEDEEYRIEESPEREVKTFDEYVCFYVNKGLDRHTKDPTFYIDLKSEDLRDILREVLKDVYGLSLVEEKPTIERHVLYHYLPELESYRTSHADIASMEHLDLLIDCVTEIYAPTTQRLLPLQEHGEITYDLLWALFKPNTPVYTTCFGTKKPRCVIYDSAEEMINRSKKKYWSMDCRFSDFDGKTFGKASIELVIPKFRGTKRINTLPAFPLKYHLDEKQVKSDLVECGRKFVRLTGTHHCHCQGGAFLMHKGDAVRFSVDSRVMIDANFFWKMNPNYSRPRTDLARTRPEGGSGPPPGGPPGRDQVKSDDVEPADLTEDDFLICCPTVPGFSFGGKLWAEFAVADIEDIKWSPSPYACLSIPDEQRDVIMALVEARIDPSVVFDDFVVGKGKGLNILLHGPPGVGKTFTEEAVSEHLKRPLYSVSISVLYPAKPSLIDQISVGELLLDVAELEDRIFKTASHWNAILFPDEADVFLERRSPDNLTRNGLVSVFLRKLEYYEGILFLTTNRVSQFDEAILSRIHLMLRYDDLTKDVRKQVWGNFLSRATTSSGDADVTDKELEELAIYKLNGRQIKNIMSAAQAFASKARSKIRFPHVKKAVKANEKFFREFYGKDFVDANYG